MSFPTTKIPLYPSPSSLTPNKFKTPSNKNLEASISNKTPTPAAEANILKSLNYEPNGRKFYFVNEKKTDKKNEEDFYNYHNSNKLLFKKANKIEKKEEFVLKEISNKINSQQNCVIIDENGGRSGSSNKIIKKNLKNLIHTENFMSQSFNTNFDGMIEKVDSFFADDIDPKNINSNRSESISIFSVPTNIYATKNKEEGSSLIQPYSDMADFENKFNEIDAGQNELKKNENVIHTFLDLKQEIEKDNNKNQYNSFYEEEFRNMKEIIHQLQLKDAIHRQNLSKIKKCNEDYKIEINEWENKYNNLMKQREKDIEYIKQMDSQIHIYEEKINKSINKEKLEEKLKEQNDIIYDLLNQNKDLKKKNIEFEKVLKNILYEKEVKNKIYPNQQKIKTEDYSEFLISSQNIHDKKINNVNKKKRSKSELGFKKL